MEKPYVKLQPHEYLFELAAKCRETLPWHSDQRTNPFEPGENGRNFADKIFKFVYLYEKCGIFYPIFTTISS